MPSQWKGTIGQTCIWTFIDGPFIGCEVLKGQVAVRVDCLDEQDVLLLLDLIPDLPLQLLIQSLANDKDSPEVRMGLSPGLPDASPELKMVGC